MLVSAHIGPTWRHFLFEPRLDPDVDAATRAELDALGVVAIYANGSPWSETTPSVVLLDADGDPVTLP